MNNSSERLYYLPPSWGLVILFAICGLIFGLFINYDIQSNLAVFAHFNIPGLALSCIFAILATISYSFYPDRLEIRMLRLTIRRICWKNVTGAMLFESLGKKRRQPYLVICVSPCQPIDPRSVEFSQFDRKNLRHIVRIPVPKKTMEILAVFEQLHIKVCGIPEK